MTLAADEQRALDVVNGRVSWEGMSRDEREFMRPARLAGLLNEKLQKDLDELVRLRALEARVIELEQTMLHTSACQSHAVPPIGCLCVKGAIGRAISGEA